MTVALLIALAFVGQSREHLAGCLTDHCRVGDTGHLAKHMQRVRGELLEDAARVITVLSEDSAVMVNYYAISTRELGTFRFVIKGVSTVGWEAREVRQVPHKLKVTGWHRLGPGNEIQILEPDKTP